ncbi:HIT domain-containing protein [Candidatus Omnitrophota bacterium]
MKKLWAPWRSKFIYSRKKKGCIFCAAKNAKSQEKHFVVKKTKSSFSILNIYPYNTGHMMVAPKRHVSRLDLLAKAETSDLMALVNKTTKALDKLLKPKGYNIGVNIGAAAGAGFPGHVHIHIVPRWNGDTNFMPVLSETKVISESLDSLYERLIKNEKK